MFIATPPMLKPFRSAADAQGEQAARIRASRVNTVLRRSRAATIPIISVTNRIKRAPEGALPSGPCVILNAVFDLVAKYAAEMSKT
jgi:hypothetical protein